VLWSSSTARKTLASFFADIDRAGAHPGAAPDRGRSPSAACEWGRRSPAVSAWVGDGGCCDRGPVAVVRLGGRRDRAVEVCSCAVRSRAVSNRNCVVATRGGEQRNENDQSVTQAIQWGSRRELDSVSVEGRACDRVAKPVSRR
jgi:hypothetical protein